MNTADERCTSIAATAAPTMLMAIPSRIRRVMLRSTPAASDAVAFDDDALGFPPGESEITFPVVAGNCYMIQVGTFSATTTTGSRSAMCTRPTSDILFIGFRHDVGTQEYQVLPPL